MISKSLRNETTGGLIFGSVIFCSNSQKVRKPVNIVTSSLDKMVKQRDLAFNITSYSQAKVNKPTQRYK